MLRMTALLPIALFAGCATGEALDAALDASGSADDAADSTPNADATADVANDGGTPDGGGGTCSVALSYTFEGGDDGFVHAGLDGSSDPWHVGEPSSVSCHGGSRCFLTGKYSNCQSAELALPPVDLSGCAGSPKTVRLSFWHHYEFEPLATSTSTSYFDGGVLQISTDGASWTDVVTSQAYDGVFEGAYSSCSATPLIAGKTGWGGTIAGGGWTEVTYDIPDAYRVSGLRLRFVFGSDLTTTRNGWAIDDVSITSL